MLAAAINSTLMAVENLTVGSTVGCRLRAYRKPAMSSSFKTTSRRTPKSIRRSAYVCCQLTSELQTVLNLPRLRVFLHQQARWTSRF